MGMTANAIWHSGLSFTGSAGSGFTVPMGASVEEGGLNDGFRPMELLIVGLAGCTGMDVVAILRNKQQRVTGFEVQVSTDRATTYPMIFSKIYVKYIISGHQVDHNIVDYAIKMSADKYCSAEAMLAESAQFEHSYDVIEVPESQLA